MKTRRELLAEFVAQDPDDSFSRYALALELEKEEAPEEAVAQLKEVLLRDPGYVAAYQHLGRLLTILGQVDAARGAYERGLEFATRSDDQRARNEMQEALDALD